MRTWQWIREQHPNRVLWVDGKFTQPEMWTEPVHVGQEWSFFGYTYEWYQIYSGA